MDRGLLSTDAALAKALAGESLWGDDFSSDQIEQWFADEAEASFDLDEPRLRGEYPWAAQQWLHGYARIPTRRWKHVLGFGSAFGQELKPLEAEKCTIVESSVRFEANGSLPFPVEYLLANSSGHIDLPDSCVDLIVCFGVLHHIPNVSTVLSEFSRVSTRGGYLLVAEPCVSMGDWRKPRVSLTAHERGIPVQWMRQHLADVGFDVKRVGLVGFPVIQHLGDVLHLEPYNSKLAVRLDAAICRLLAPHMSYHAINRISKLRPTSANYVATHVR
jgi:SAM-dependent methyltransferase